MKALNLKMVYARVAPWALPFLVVLFLLSLFTCNRQRGAVADLRLDFDSVARLAHQFENERGQIVAENQLLKAESAKQLNELTDTIFNLKKREQNRIKEATSYARIIQQFNSGPKLAPFTEVFDYSDPENEKVGFHPVGVSKPGSDTSYIRVPAPFLYIDSTVEFRGRVTRVGVWLDSIRVENTVHFRTVVQKHGFLNMARKTSVQALNSNPAITTVGITAIEVPNRPNWWQKWGKLAAGAILGGVGVHQLTR